MVLDGLAVAASRSGVRSTGAPPERATVHTCSAVRVGAFVEANTSSFSSADQATPAVSVGTSASWCDPSAPQTCSIECAS